MQYLAQKRPTPPRPSTLLWGRTPHGSALILTMLILLVLTGLGMTAMHSVGHSLRQSSAYRVRAQASGLANAAVLYTSTQAGKHAQNYWSEMNRFQNDRFRTSSGSRIANAQRGAYLMLSQDNRSGGSRAFTDIDVGGETGLLAAGNSSSASIPSFESDHRGTGVSQFTSVVRDPMDGPGAPGAGENSCFKRVTVASQAVVGDPVKSRKGVGSLGNKRAVIETYIGPVDCGAR